MKIRFNGSGLLLPVFLLFFLILSFSVVFGQESDFSAILDEVAHRLARREFSAALELFDRLPEEEANKIEVRIIRASILNAAGRTNDARQIANAIIAADSMNTEALMILADAAAIDGRERDRRTFLDRVIGIDPANVRALNDLGNINLGNQNLRTAAGYFDRALASDPVNGDALIGRAAVYRYNREPRNAERLLNQAIDLYPGWAAPLHERARLYRGAGFYTDALEDLDFALSLEPDNYWILVDHGTVLMDMGLKQNALESFNQAIAVNPDIFMAYVYSAGIKDELGDYDGAERDYVTLARLRPDYYFAFEAIGVIRMRNKQWALARDAFLDAYRQAPTEFSYAILASICWMRAGRTTDPRTFLAQVLRTAPRDSLDFAMLRLFHDLSGEIDLSRRVESEVNIYTRSRMLFYLASYFDITGSGTLAEMYYLMVQELEVVASIEWRLNEMVLEERGIGIRREQ